VGVVVMPRSWVSFYANASQSGAGQVLWIGQPRRLVVQIGTWF
jgi:hypothetical protein